MQEENSKNTHTEDVVLDYFTALQKEHDLDQNWIDSFIYSMESDLFWERSKNTKNSYLEFKDTQSYIYGSADVVGLMMAKILNLPILSYFYAQKLGAAFQYINFIRDVSEDIDLGRNYFAETELKKYDLSELSRLEIELKPKNFVEFMRSQILRYLDWQEQAELGFAFIPWRYRMPIVVASRMYIWTAQQIYKNPLIVFTKKIKPRKRNIILCAININIQGLFGILKMDNIK